VSEFDVSEYTGYDAVLAKENDQLKMSNERLIAELGRVALALGVEPSMRLVLAKIEELKAK
jgi:hypothetical protein